MKDIVQRDKMPTPLYVTDGGRKKVLLSYNTQEEADAALRILSALAAMHANTTHALEEDRYNPKNLEIVNNRIVLRLENKRG